MAEPVRLAKRVAAMVPCSRREAEQYIEGGFVRVDGQVVDQPQARVADAQVVALDATASLDALEPVTLLLHKPANLSYEQAQRLLVADKHAADDASGIRVVRKHFTQLTPLMPMLEEASGLAVFSQDFRVVRKLQEDERFIEQELVVQVAGTLAEGGLDRLCHGLHFNGKPLPPARVSWQSETRLRFAVKGITPGQAAWMCEQVGLKVEAVKRIRIGRVAMAGLAPGQWRYLPAGLRF